MAIAYSRDKNSKSRNQQSGQASNYKKATKFIPPTHPAYIVTSNFKGSHISQLQQQFDKNYIAISMQTSKKKLSKIPDTPTDKYFIVVDDSAQPIVLQGQFLTLNKKVVNYPGANNVKQVVEQFSSYIGLGHMEVKEENGKSSYNLQGNRSSRQHEEFRKRLQGESKLMLGRQMKENGQNYSSSSSRQIEIIDGNGKRTIMTRQMESTTVNNGRNAVSNQMSTHTQQMSRVKEQLELANATSQLAQGLSSGDKFRRGTSRSNMLQSNSNNFSNKSKSKLTLKEIVTRNEELKISQGCIYIYKNAKDIEEYKLLLSEIKQRYGQSTIINVVYSIDQYNYACKMSKEISNIILMTQNSYTRVSKFFKNYHSIVIYTDGSEQIEYKNYDNVALFTNDSERIFRFIEEFGKKKEQIRKMKNEKQLTQLEREKDKESIKGSSIPNRQQVQQNGQRKNSKGVSTSKQPQAQPNRKIEREGSTQYRVDNLKSSPAQSIGLGNFEPSHKIYSGGPAESMSPSFVGFNDALEDYRKRGSPKGNSKIKLLRVQDIDQAALKTFKKTTPLPKEYSYQAYNNIAELQVQPSPKDIQNGNVSPSRHKIKSVKSKGKLDQQMKIDNISQIRADVNQPFFCLENNFESPQSIGNNIQKSKPYQRVNCEYPDNTGGNKLETGLSLEPSNCSPSSKRIRRLKSNRKIDEKTSIRQPSRKEQSTPSNPLQNQQSPLMTAHLRKSSDVGKQNNQSREERLRYARRRSHAQPEQVKLAVRCQKSLRSLGQGEKTLNNKPSANAPSLNLRSSIQSKSQYTGKKVRFQPTIGKLVEGSRSMDSDHTGQINDYPQIGIDNIKSFEEESSESERDNSLSLKKSKVDPGTRIGGSIIREEKQYEGRSEQQQQFEIYRPFTKGQNEEASQKLLKNKNKQDKPIESQILIHSKGKSYIEDGSSQFESEVFVSHNNLNENHKNEKKRIKKQCKSAEDYIYEDLAMKMTSNPQGRLDKRKTVRKGCSYPPEIYQMDSSVSQIEEYQFIAPAGSNQQRDKHGLINANIQDKKLSEENLSHYAFQDPSANLEHSNVFHHSDISSIHGEYEMPKIQILAPSQTKQKKSFSQQSSDPRFSFGGANAQKPTDNRSSFNNPSSLTKGLNNRSPFGGGNQETKQEKKGLPVRSQQSSVSIPKVRMMTSGQKSKNIVSKIFKQLTPEYPKKQLQQKQDKQGSHKRSKGQAYFKTDSQQNTSGQDINPKGQISFVSESQTEEKQLKKMPCEPPQKKTVKEEDPYGLPILKPLKRKNVSLRSPQKQNQPQKQSRPYTGSKARSLRSHRSNESTKQVGKIYVRYKDKNIQAHHFDSDYVTDQFNTNNSKISRVKSVHLPYGYLAKSRVSADNRRLPRRPSPQENQTSQRKQKPRIEATACIKSERKRSLSDIIDLSKYEKRIQNGVTVYRAKEPIIISKNSNQPFSSRPMHSKKSGDSDPFSNVLWSSEPSNPINGQKYNNIYDQIRQQTSLPYQKLPPLPSQTPQKTDTIPLQLSGSDRYSKQNDEHEPTSSVRYSNKSIFSSQAEEVNRMKKQFCKNLLSASQQLKKYSRGINKFDSQQKKINSNQSTFTKSALDSNPKHTNKSTYPPKSPKLIEPNKNNYSAQCSFNVDDNLTTIRNLQALGQEEPNGINQLRNNKSTASIKQNKEPLSNKRSNKLSRVTSLPGLPQKQLPRISEKKIEENGSDEERSIDSKYQHIILYLIDRKRQRDFPEINLIKNQKDTLVFYKNIKKLAQQLQKARNVYDLVYIIPRVNDPTVHNIVKLYPNCYVLDFNQGSKINERCVTIPNFSVLQDISHSLIEENVLKRKNCSAIRNNSKPKGKLGTSVYDPNVCMYNCCFHSRPQNCHCRCSMQVPALCEKRDRI